MKKQFIRLTSGWIPVSVLVLFTIALIAGQARANLPGEIKATPVFPASVNLVLSSDMLKRLESLPHMVDTVLALPSDLEVSVDATIIALRESGYGASSVQTKSQPKTP